jgi:hypothetical protein
MHCDPATLLRLHFANFNDTKLAKCMMRLMIEPSNIAEFFARYARGPPWRVGGR